jgi:hypothetical protein
MVYLDGTKKLDVYHLLYRLNLSFAAIVKRCRALEQSRIFRIKFLRVFQGQAQELQAEINEELLDTLHQIELEDWSRFGKISQARDKELRDPDDVFIEAERRKEQLHKQGKKPPRLGMRRRRAKKVQSRGAAGARH